MERRKNPSRNEPASLAEVWLPTKQKSVCEQYSSKTVPGVLQQLCRQSRLTGSTTSHNRFYPFYDLLENGFKDFDLTRNINVQLSDLSCQLGSRTSSIRLRNHPS